MHMKPLNLLLRGSSRARRIYSSMICISTTAAMTMDHPPKPPVVGVPRNSRMPSRVSKPVPGRHDRRPHRHPGAQHITTTLVDSGVSAATLQHRSERIGFVERYRLPRTASLFW